MSIDYTAAYADLYARAASHADGALVRGLVGSIFPANELAQLTGKTLPYLVWRDRGIAGDSESMLSVNAAWFIYATPNANPRVLHTIASELDALYHMAPLAIPFGRLGVTYRGATFTDEALNNLTGMEVRIGYRRLG